jgi:acylphosphatase
VRIARHYLIGGRVQGVGFRFFTQAGAEREGIDGWVRNTPDGRVEIEAYGDTDAMMRFDRAIREGPPGARVEQVEVTELPTPATHSGFRIR